MPSHPVTVISLGGSLLAPVGGPNAKFLKKFRDLVLSLTRKGHRFVIICGGGAVCREYQAAAKATGTLTPMELNWLGIQATRFNAQLLRTVFRKAAHPTLVINPNEVPSLDKIKIAVGAGYQPGRSTDYDTVLVAQACSAQSVVNLSDVKFVYDADPRTNPEAKAMPKLTWKEFRKRFGGGWSPGAHGPFDPYAAKLAEKLGLRVVIMDGVDPKNVEKAVTGQKFRGTEITV
jgi:uridylate kinase